MEELEQLKEKLATERPVSWTEFPDIGLYKDQVISYMLRQLINFENGGLITSAMLNNYIKDKLLPRADGKKYSREHLAGLTEICVLKQVLSVSDTGLLLNQEIGRGDPEKFYFKFRKILDKALDETAEQVKTDLEVEEISDMALHLAISSYCDKLVSERLLDIIRGKERKLPVDEMKKNENKPDKKPENKVEKKKDNKQDKKPEKRSESKGE